MDGKTTLVDEPTDLKTRTDQPPTEQKKKFIAPPYDIFRHQKLSTQFKFDRQTLSEAEFDELITQELAWSLLSNPAISETFSPEEELAKIRALPKKDTELAVFKDKLARQMEAWAYCRAKVEEFIDYRPDIAKDRLMSLVDKFGQAYGFPDGQKKMIEELVDAYFDHQKRSVAYAKKYPIALDLVNALTGLQLDEETDFEMTMGPIYLTITTDGITAKKIFDAQEHAVSLPDIKGLPYGGFMAKTGDDPPLFFFVINKNFPEDSTLLHEYQHLKNAIYWRILNNRIDSDRIETVWSHYGRENDPVLKQIYLDRYFRLAVEEACEWAGDEVLATEIDQHQNISPQFNWDFLFRKDGSAHDYLAKVRDYEQSNLWQARSQKILVEEYEQIVRKAIESFDRLQATHRYTTNQIVALLSGQPLLAWPKITRRLLEAQPTKT